MISQNVEKFRNLTIRSPSIIKENREIMFLHQLTYFLGILLISQNLNLRFEEIQEFFKEASLVIPFNYV